MAPKYPDEVDVFTEPHSRMKHLVQKYFDMVSSTNFRDAVCMTSMLENLLHTFNEFKMHEQIENRFIMRRLKEKMNALHIRDAAVCNCHSDNRLTEMLGLVLEGYRWAQCSEQEREKYGHTLRQALEEFTQVFIPHMEEEEEVFQPMLVEYFTYDELKELKAKVIQKHFEKEYEKDDTFASDTDAVEKEDKGQFQDKILPSEIMIQIFSYLSPKDLCQCAQVSKRWNELVVDPVLWPAIHPVSWASGNWSFRPPEKTEDEIALGSEDEECYCGGDEDADVDESSDSNCDSDDEAQAEHKLAMREVQILSGLVKHVLPKVGTGVEKINLSHSRGLSSSLVHKVLKLCPNLLHLDLSYTKVMDTAFKEYGMKGGTGKLRHLDLTGCEKITDVTLHSLAGMGSPSCHDLSQKPVVNTQKPWTPGDLCVKNCCRGTVKICVSGVDEDLKKPLSFQRDIIVEKDPSFTDLAFLCQLECWQAFGLEPANQGKGENIVITQESGQKKDTPFCCSVMKTKQGRGQAPETGTVCCGRGCMQSFSACNDQNKTSKDLKGDATPHALHNLTFLSLNSCFRITDEGLRALSKRGGLPFLQHLDLSGCLNVSTVGVAALVDACHTLDHAHLYYCDNLYPDPFPTSASGCRNLQCSSRVCCRSGE